MAFLLCLSMFAVISPSHAQAQSGPYVDQARFILRPDENLALEEVKSGALDMYFFRIPLESADDAKNDPRLRVYERSAGSMGFFVNPAPSTDSVINPFSSREARFALNYLIDREFMVQEILRGYGSPMLDAFGPSSPEYLNIIDVVESFGIRYNPALAESIISKAMIESGATLQGGKWMFNGNPVTISIVIRQDDSARKSMGELMASELEKIGFSVQRDFGDLNKANAVVYGSDPADLQWHMYTEGFAGTAAFVKYNPVVPAQMYAPWYTRMPGSQNPDFWNYENSTLDKLSQDIFFFNFTSEQQRNELVRTSVEMGMQEAVRLFVAQKTDPYVASVQLQGLVNDFGAGITSKYALANVRDSGGDDAIDVGVKQIHQGSWNIIGGLQDTYSRDIYSSISDSGSFRHPYSGAVIPMRTEWTDVATEGPLGTLEVAEALLWNPATQEWVQVEGNSTAKSRVTFTPLYSNWHHGIPMDISDFMYSQYFTTEWGTTLGESDRTFDPEFTPQAEVALQYLKGVRFAPDGIVSYIDIWHYDELEIADSGVFWVTEPWEITAATERLVIDGKFAFSRSGATSEGISWYDPIVQDHAEMVLEELQKMKTENFVPAALREVVTPEKAAERYDAAISWISSKGHAVVSNGGFYLDNFNSAGGTITIKAFRDSTYPFEQGHWSMFENPQLARIDKVNLPRSVTIGQPADVSVDVSVGGEPGGDADVVYFISSRDGSVIATGTANQTGAGQFTFSVTAEASQKLTPGPNQLKVFATARDVIRYDISTNTLLASATSSSGNQTSNNTGGTTVTPDAPSGCLIATAAFGSELTPQVQYLRNFREHYILSTVAGSAFMNTFNSIYYSFSPQVADYEREQPWLQSIVKTGIYPLFGILTLSERAHFGAGGGELGAISSGAVAGILIGAVYLWPAALSTRVQNRLPVAVKALAVLIAASVALTVIGLAAHNASLLAISTPIFVVALAAAGALAIGWLARTAKTRITNSRL